MTLRHIKIFLSVCECECNTTRAAEALYMTQPAVSLAIHELEEYYGVKLFDRFGRRLVISEAGIQFKEYALRIVSLFDDMEKRMRNWDSYGILRVGASITIGSQFLPGYVKAFYHRYPGTEIHAIVASTEQLEKKLLTNEIDFALIEGIAHSPSIISEPYMEDRLSVICSANSAFKQGQKLTMEQFLQQKFLLREKGSGTREVFDRVLEAAGYSITPVWEAMSTNALVQAVINNLGIAVLPHRMVTNALERKQIVTVTVDELDFRRNFYIIYHQEKFLTTSAHDFLDLCRNYEMDYPLNNYFIN